ncbi:hypothetical protein FJT64_014985 [Amphibalanus amphitrite]|uniref:Uncharacterized protein n=1 Tax=Amphibalanus amphitrite TaxID=1232801 RepID=A0A6A4X5S9_AMPAM|nr:hypothetical protein FJT64_014985 [Amphibalanus amphitrite]
MAQPTGAELVQDLTTMLREQAAAAQEREQRLVSMMEDLLRGQGQVLVTHNSGSGSLLCIPDSGAEATVVGPKEAAALGVSDYGNGVPPQTFSAAGGYPLTSVGSFQATIQLGSRRITTEIAVIGELRGALLSWWDSVQLGIFPADYPLQLHQMSLPDRSRTTTARNAAPADETARGAAAAPPAQSAVPEEM